MASDGLRHVLDGYKVLNFTQVLAGPTVTRSMARWVRRLSRWNSPRRATSRAAFRSGLLHAKALTSADRSDST